MPNLIEILLVLVLAWVLTACSSVEQKLDSNIYYQRDLQVTINDTLYTGSAVVPRSGQYVMSVKALEDIDMAFIKTCAREDVTKGKSTGAIFFKSKKEFDYTLIPNSGLEDEKTCPLTLDVFNKKKGVHQWFFADFTNREYNSKFKMDCNGRRISIDGVGVCSMRENLIIRAQFDEPVRFAPPPRGCAEPIEYLGNIYKWQVSYKPCLYVFDTQGGRKGKFTTLGYRDALVRGE